MTQPHLVVELAPRVPFANHDQVLEALTADPDHSLGVPSEVVRLIRLLVLRH